MVQTQMSKLTDLQSISAVKEFTNISMEAERKVSFPFHLAKCANPGLFTVQYTFKIITCSRVKL